MEGYAVSAKVRKGDTDKVIKRLNEEIAKLKERNLVGLLSAGLYIEGVAKKQVPVEYGDLRRSGYTRKAQGDKTKVEIGFTAAYALFVHENLEQRLKGKDRKSGKGVYWGPNGRPKYLTSVLTEHRAKILDIIRKESRLKPKKKVQERL